LGVLAVHLNLKRLDDIVGNNQGLGSSGETYLVANLGSNFANRNILLSSAAFGSDKYPEGVESDGITAAMSGEDGRGLYLSHQSRPVIGVYRWLDGQDVALIVEMDQSEAFAPARHLAAVIGLVGVSLAGLLTAGIILMGRRIVQPIRAIAQTAEQMENRLKAGEIEALELAPILTENEIGTLARTFNQMVHQLQTSYAQLQEYNLSLEAKVQARTQELSVKNEDLKATLSKLKATQMQLIQNEKMASLGQMVAGIAHEINNPVNFIFGNLKHLDEYIQNLWELIKTYEQEAASETVAIVELKEEIDLDFLKDDLPKMLNSIKLGTVRIREIVTSLRNFSRLDEAERKEADLHEGLDSTLLILQNRLKAKPNRPAIQIIKDYRCTQSIECYPSQLNQVFLNLLGNAIDALEPGAIAGENPEPTIHILTALEGDLDNIQ
jgi:signal transduction histidine kinase